MSHRYRASEIAQQAGSSEATVDRGAVPGDLGGCSLRRAKRLPLAWPNTAARWPHITDFTKQPALKLACTRTGRRRPPH